jgi:phosphonate transport system permease protein
MNKTGRGKLIGRGLLIGALIVLLICLGDAGLLDADRLRRGALNIGLFVRGMFPPDWSVLPAVSRALVETLQIAFAGTSLGFALALPLALAATRALFGATVTVPAKFLLALIRTVPALLWAIVFVVAVGLGPGAGTLGVALYTCGFLGKVFYETFEGVDAEVIEAVRGVGCGRAQLARYALLPEAANVVLAQLIFMFEYNVRASAIMGFVGAGGVGFYLLGYIQSLQYDRLLAALLLTLLLVVLIDRISARIRKVILAPAGNALVKE